MTSKNRKKNEQQLHREKKQKNDRFREKKEKIPKVHENAKKTLSIDNFLNEFLRFISDILN